MTTAQKQFFIVELIESVKKDLLEKAQYMPEEWDGLELRQYIADQFAGNVFGGNITNHRSRRYRLYKNEIIINRHL